MSDVNNEENRCVLVYSLFFTEQSKIFEVFNEEFMRLTKFERSSFFQAKIKQIVTNIDCFQEYQSKLKTKNRDSRELLTLTDKHMKVFLIKFILF